ncbi:ATP-binding protein [Pontibacillus salicampi]|uniref:histidine kinase n=1 Tax=Pontibacillus salicampi TaxID=1449801 RepID=A0ABV6LJ30_9BACI
MFTAKSLRHNRLFILIGCVLLLSAYLIGVILMYPYIGIDVEENASGQWVVEGVAPHSWSDKHDIEKGTIVQAIDGKSPEEHSTVLMFQTIEKASSITLLLGQPTTFTRIEQEVSLDQWLFYIIFPSIFMVIMLLLSLFIIWHKRYDEAGNRLTLFFLAIGLAYLAGSGTARGEYVSTFTNTLMFLLTPALLLDFIDSYFKTFRERWFSRATFQGMKVIALLAAIIEAFFFYVEWYPSWYPQLISVLFVAFAMTALIIVVKGYILFRKTPYAPILQYLVYGIFAAFIPFTFFSLLPQYMFQVNIVSAEITLIFLLALPITFIYLITAQRLFDIDFVIGRVRYYAYVSVVPTSLLLLLVMLLIDFNWEIRHVFQLFFSIWFMLIVFLYVKEIFDFRIQRNLFTEKNNYNHSMQRFVQEMKSEKHAIGLFTRLRRELLDVIGVEMVHIFSKNTISNYFCVYYSISEELMRECEQRIKEESAEAGTLVYLKKHEGYVLIVGHTVSKITYLYCSEKPNKTVLNLDEKSYLQTMSYNANIAFENLLLIEDLFQELQLVKNDTQQHYPMWLSRLLFSLSENQRKQIAVDLHDTVLQEQLFLYRQMDDFINRYDSTLQEDVEEKLVHLREQMLDNIHLIRETCNELRPPFLEEMGLVPSLENLIEVYQLRSNFTVQFDSSYFRAELNSEYVLGLYRMVQELLTNAMKHSEASKVMLSLKENNGDVELQYIDNGVGMDMEAPIDSFAHMGLSSIEQRVNGLNGEITIYSEPNEGFQLNVVLYQAVNHGGRRPL